MKRIILAVVLLCSALLFCGCWSSKTIRAVKATPAQTRAYYGLSGPTVQGLSFEARNYLQTNLLMELYYKEPSRLIGRLCQDLEQEPSTAMLNVLSDVCYTLALQTDDPDSANPYYLSAAYGYYRLLFDQSLRENGRNSRFEPEILRAAMRYNVAVGMIFQYMNQRSLLDRKAFALPQAAGQQVFFANPMRLNLSFPREGIRRYHLCADYRAERLLHFSYNFGLGTPLFAETDQVRDEQDGLKLTKGLTLPVTCILQFRTGKNGEIRAYLEMFDTMKYDTVSIHGEQVPLTQDFSTPSAYYIDSREAPKLLRYALNPAKDSYGGLYALSPYDKDKIPLVFVHGLMSSPQTWIQMVNTLASDPVIRRNYQVWYYTYSSGNPILLSAMKMREALDAAARKHGNDPNFRKMVLVGHSMGGLLSKTFIMNSGDVILDRTLNRPWREARDGLSDKEVRFLEELAILKKRDYVSRVVFMAVPHRGSSMADWGISHFAASLVTLPAKIVKDVQGITEKLFPEKTDRQKSRKLYTGFDNLSPENPALKALAEIPLASDVPCHSIIGNREKAGVPGGSDGVVSYRSSHLDQVESERIVQSGHSVQGNSEAVRELRRILHKHLKRTAKKSASGLENP